MSTPLDTDRSLSTELVDLRRQVRDLQQALAQAEQDRARGQASALDAAQVGTWEWDGSTNRVLWSAETEAIFGVPPGSFDGTYEGFFALVHPDDRQQLHAAMAKAVEDRAPYRIEHRIGAPDGVVRWVACRGRATFRDSEPVTGMAGTIEDITARKELELAQQDFRETLEQQVRERTATLEQAITDLKQEAERRRGAESALKTSEQRYQSLYEQNPFMYFTLTAEGTILSVNSFGADQLGYRKEDLIGQSVLNVFDPKDRQLMLAQLKNCAASPYTLLQWETRKLRKDGSRLRVKERARAIHDHTGRLLVLVVCEDITAHAVTESLLRESEQAIRSFQEATAAPGLTFEQRMQTILELGCRKFKLPVGMLTRVAGDQLEVRQVWPPTARLGAGTLVPLSQSYCHAAMHTSGPMSIEHAGASEWSRNPGYASLGFECYLGTKLAGRRTNHGTICFLGPDPYPGTFSEADKAFLLLMARWVASELDRQESEQALRASELKFRTFVETTRDWVWEIDERAVYTYASPRIQEILGYEPENVIGKTLFDLMPPDEALRVAGLFGPIVAARRPFTLLENTNRHKNGHLVVLETSGTPIFDSAGTFRGYHGIDRDITDRKRTEEALRTSETELQRFVAEAPVGLCILDENWRAVKANKALCELTGYAEHEIVGSTYALYTHPEDLAANIMLTDEFFRGVRSEYTYEKRYIRKSGEIIWVSVKATRVELSGHAGPLLLAAVQDITERKLAMEEREQLSRDLHDNILQALYAVGMQLEAGKLSIGKSPRTSKLHMAQAVNQLNALMLDIRRFITSLTQRTTRQLDFGPALRQLVTSMSSASQAPPELDIVNPVLSFITPKQGEQLLNIVREALSNSTRHAQASHRWIRLSLAENAIHLIIGDNGVGFSTVRKRRAGHGLRNMAARAKQISSIYTLKSAPGKGTCVMVDIPLKKEHIYE